MALLVGFGCFVSHHMAVLIVVFAMGYALAAFQVHYLLKIVPHRRKAAIFAFNLTVLASIMTVSFIFFDFFGELLLANLQKTSIFDLDPPFLSAILNTASSYTNQIGFILPVAVLGFGFVYRTKSTIDTSSLFLVATLIAFVPLLGSHLYVSMLLTPIVAIIGGLVIAHLYQKSSRKIYCHAFVTILLVSSIIMPYWSIERWNSNEYISGDTVETDEILYSDSIYLRYAFADTLAICSVGTIRSQLYSNSGMTFISSGIMLALNDELNASDMDENVIWSESNFPVNLYRWFQYEDEPQVDYYIRGLMINGLAYISNPQYANDAVDYFHGHPKLTIVVDNNWPSQYVDTYSIREAPFLGELANGLSTEATGVEYSGDSIGSYLTYTSERISVYIVDIVE